MARTLLTISPSPSSRRHASCSPSAFRYVGSFLFGSFLVTEWKEQLHFFNKISSCAQLVLEMSYWTVVNTLFVLGSLAMYFVVTFAMYSNGSFLLLPRAFSFIGERSNINKTPQRKLSNHRVSLWDCVRVSPGSARNSLGQPVAWLSICLTSILCVLPVVTYRFLSIRLCPSVNEKVQLTVF